MQLREQSSAHAPDLSHGDVAVKSLARLWVCQVTQSFQLRPVLGQPVGQLGDGFGWPPATQVGTLVIC